VRGRNVCLPCVVLGLAEPSLMLMAVPCRLASIYRPTHSHYTPPPTSTINQTTNQTTKQPTNQTNQKQQVAGDLLESEQTVRELAGLVRAAQREVEVRGPRCSSGFDRGGRFLFIY
jgi:hypothetical protein